MGTKFSTEQEQNQLPQCTDQECTDQESILQQSLNDDPNLNSLWENANEMNRDYIYNGLDHYEYINHVEDLFNYIDNINLDDNIITAFHETADGPLKKRFWMRYKHIDIGKELGVCTICHDDMFKGQPLIRRADCGHMYHIECYNAYQEHRKEEEKYPPSEGWFPIKCPVCRGEDPNEDRVFERIL